MGNSNCIFLGCIDQASVGVVERWGRFHRLAQPGLQFFNIFAGECLAGILSTRINSLDVTIETKTKVLTLILNFRFSVVSIDRSWWVCVARFVNYIVRFQRLLPWIFAIIALSHIIGFWLPFCLHECFIGYNIAVKNFRVLAFGCFLLWCSWL